MCTLGFDNYVEPLTLYLHKYRETTKSDRAVGNASADSRTSEFSEYEFFFCVNMLKVDTLN